MRLPWLQPIPTNTLQSLPELDPGGPIWHIFAKNSNCYRYLHSTYLKKTVLIFLSQSIWHNLMFWPIGWGIASRVITYEVIFPNLPIFFRGILIPKFLYGHEKLKSVPILVCSQWSRNCSFWPYYNSWNWFGLIWRALEYVTHLV